jgi:hypothetical protein
VVCAGSKHHKFVPEEPLRLGFLAVVAAEDVVLRPPMRIQALVVVYSNSDSAVGACLVHESARKVHIRQRTSIAGHGQNESRIHE